MHTLCQTLENTIVDLPRIEAHTNAVKITPNQGRRTMSLNLLFVPSKVRFGYPVGKPQFTRLSIFVCPKLGVIQLTPF